MHVHVQRFTAVAHSTQCLLRCTRQWLTVTKLESGARRLDASRLPSLGSMAITSHLLNLFMCTLDVSKRGLYVALTLAQLSSAPSCSPAALRRSLGALPLT